jgi:hypothetical protein
MSYIEKRRSAAPLWIGAVIALAVLGRCAIGIDLPGRLDTPAGIERELLNDPDNGALYATIKRTYPEEFDTLTRNAAERIARGMSHQDVADALTTDLIAANERHRREMLQAPSAELAAYRIAELRLIDAMLEHDPEMCATFVTTGAVRADHSRVPVRLFADLRAATWEADAAGRDRPVRRKIGPIGAEVVTAIRSNMIADGVPPTKADAYLDKGAAIERSHAGQCRAGRAVLRAIHRLPAAQADEVQATLHSAT